MNDSIPAETRAAEAPTNDSPRVVVDNVEAQRFELLDTSDSVTALRSFADYTIRDGAVVVPHVETAPEHRGNGFAEELMDGIVADLRETGRTIVPICPFAAHYFRLHPETQELLERPS